MSLTLQRANGIYKVLAATFPTLVAGFVLVQLGLQTGLHSMLLSYDHRVHADLREATSTFMEERDSASTPAASTTSISSLCRRFNGSSGGL